MIDGKKVLGIIPARGGSRGLPRKNVLPLAGKPLIAWTIEAGHASKYIDRLVLSTDDREIADVGRTWGVEVPFMRPPELARDDTPTMDVIRHALQMLPGYDLIVVLQPTSPLRLAEDIDGCLERMIRRGAKTCVSVTESEHVPEWMFHLDESGGMHPIVTYAGKVQRRQDSRKAYVLNGAVYAGVRGAFWNQDNLIDGDTLAYPMPKQRSFDVDGVLEFKICEWLIQRGNFAN